MCFLCMSIICILYVHYHILFWLYHFFPILFMSVFLNCISLCQHPFCQNQNAVLWLSVRFLYILDILLWSVCSPSSTLSSAWEQRHFPSFFFFVPVKYLYVFLPPENAFLCMWAGVLTLADLQHTSVRVVDSRVKFFLRSLHVCVCVRWDSEWISARAQGLAERTSQTSSLWLWSLGAGQWTLKAADHVHLCLCPFLRMSLFCVHTSEFMCVLTFLSCWKCMLQEQIVDR